MSITSLIPLVLKVSIVSLVFAVGLRSTPADTTELLRRPGLLLRSLLSMNVVMLVVAVLMIRLIELPLPAQVALVALAVSPVPPLLPRKLAKVLTERSYVLSLVVSAAILSLVLTPLSIELIGAYFDEDVHVAPWRLAPIVLVLIIIPLALGIFVRNMLPGIAERLAHWIGTLASALLTLAAIVLLIMLWRSLLELIGSGVLLALILFSTIGVIVGHILGGPRLADREVLGLATSVRHPGIAVTIASINYPDEKAALIVVLGHLIIGGVIAIAYKAFCAHVASQATPPG